MGRFVVGISGASGVVLARGIVENLANAGYDIDLVVSKFGYVNALQEMGEALGSPTGFLEAFPESVQERICLYKNYDMGAAIASGSVKTEGMILVPCSMATLAAVAMGLSDNLIRRAAEVTLKERLRLVVVPRETPMTVTHLENMLRITQMGGVIFPPVPAWYAQPKSLEDMEHFLVGKILDLFDIDVPYARWEAVSFP